MTSYIPDIADSEKPYYVRIADAIEADIASGKLKTGAKLPPQRHIAFDIGVTIGTIGRAYKLLLERGLVNGEVGRGTFVCERTKPANDRNITSADWRAASFHSFAPRGYDDSQSPISLISSGAADVGQAGVIAQIIANIASTAPSTLIKYTPAIPEHWQQAGAQWLSQGGWTPPVDTVIPANGIDSAILSVISTMTSPGDKIAFEQRTYGSLTRLATMTSRRPLAIAMDGEGMIPDHFESACAREHPKLVFLMPAIHNPTLCVMSEGRRREIAEIARKYNVWIIEDYVYAPLTEQDILPLAAFAPELSFVMGSLSKSVAPALHVGWVCCPANYAHRIHITHRTVTGPPTSMNHSVGAEMVLSGIAADISARVKRVMTGRSAMVREILRGHDVTTLASASFAWLKLPEPLLGSQASELLLERGVAVSPEEHFIATRSVAMSHALRLSYGPLGNDDDLARALHIIRDLLDNRDVNIIDTR